MINITLPRALGVILTVGCLSFLFKFVWFDVKFSKYLPIWALTNLLFVCVAEEAFFRGFIQKYLCLILGNIKFGHYLAILTASALFGLAHYRGGLAYMVLSMVAGMGYGWIYFKTQKIEASILTHFILNLIHFLFFTYPALNHHG